MGFMEFIQAHPEIAHDFRVVFARRWDDPVKLKEQELIDKMLKMMRKAEKIGWFDYWVDRKRISSEFCSCNPPHHSAVAGGSCGGAPPGGSGGGARGGAPPGGSGGGAPPGGAGGEAPPGGAGGEAPPGGGGGDRDGDDNGHDRNVNVGLAWEFFAILFVILIPLTDLISFLRAWREFAGQHNGDWFEDVFPLAFLGLCTILYMMLRRQAFQ